MNSVRFSISLKICWNQKTLTHQKKSGAWFPELKHIKLHKKDLEWRINLIYMYPFPGVVAGIILLKHNIGILYMKDLLALVAADFLCYGTLNLYFVMRSHKCSNMIFPSTHFLCISCGRTLTVWHIRFHPRAHCTGFINKWINYETNDEWNI